MIFGHCTPWHVSFLVQLFGITIQFVIAGIAPPDDEQPYPGIMEGGAK